ncbi:MAG: hypothetical protein ACR2K1_07995 [Saprospiraceae bacterium]
MQRLIIDRAVVLTLHRVGTTEGNQAVNHRENQAGVAASGAAALGVPVVAVTMRRRCWAMAKSIT